MSDTYIEIMKYFHQELINTFYNGVYNSRVDIGFGVLFVDRDDDYPKTDGIHTNGVHLSSEGYEMLASGDAGTFNKLFT